MTAPTGRPAPGGQIALSATAGSLRVIGGLDAGGSPSTNNFAAAGRQGHRRCQGPAADHRPDQRPGREQRGRRLVRRQRRAAWPADRPAGRVRRHGRQRHRGCGSGWPRRDRRHRHRRRARAAGPVGRRRQRQRCGHRRRRRHGRRLGRQPSPLRQRRRHRRHVAEQQRRRDRRDVAEGDRATRPSRARSTRPAPVPPTAAPTPGGKVDDRGGRRQLRQRHQRQRRQRRRGRQRRWHHGAARPRPRRRHRLGSGGNGTGNSNGGRGGTIDVSTTGCLHDGRHPRAGRRQRRRRQVPAGPGASSPSRPTTSRSAASTSRAERPARRRLVRSGRARLVAFGDLHVQNAVDASGTPAGATGGASDAGAVYLRAGNTLTAGSILAGGANGGLRGSHGSRIDLLAHDATIGTITGDGGSGSGAPNSPSGGHGGAIVARLTGRLDAGALSFRGGVGRRSRRRQRRWRRRHHGGRHRRGRRGDARRRRRQPRRRRRPDQARRDR